MLATFQAGLRDAALSGAGNNVPSVCGDDKTKSFGPSIEWIDNPCHYTQAAVTLSLRLHVSVA